MKRFPVTFTVLGTLPFVALSIAVSMHMVPDVHFTVQLLLTYAAIIVSFLSGAHWGVAVTQYTNNRKVAQILIAESVWPALLAWGILFYRDIHIQLLMLTMLYSLMWVVDCLLYERNVIPQWFFELRCIITPIVVVSLYVAYFGMV